jgi:4Fe-4S single cluster domain of Ferredoxin I
MLQCVLAAPGSFHMTEHDGRARTFVQRKSPDVAAAVSTCPVDCMHYVGFRELESLEKARDGGDGRSDHRHFGHSDARGWIPLTPLHVAGRDGDSNHKSSWYHYLKNKCYSKSR